MKPYSIGTKCFCDFHFGGKPKAKCIAVIEPGDGKGQHKGQIKVQLTETVGAYKQGETLTLPAWQAVPLKQKLPSKQGEYFTRVSTDYSWI